MSQYDRQELLRDGMKVERRYLAASRIDKKIFNAFAIRLFRYTAVLLSLTILTALIGIVFWTFGWVLNAFYNLLLSLVLAGVLGLELHPVVEFLERRLHFPSLMDVILR